VREILHRIPFVQFRLHAPDPQERPSVDVSMQERQASLP
jgi:hypothetical protein